MTQEHEKNEVFICGGPNRWELILDGLVKREVVDFEIKSLKSRRLIRVRTLIKSIENVSLPNHDDNDAWVVVGFLKDLPDPEYIRFEISRLTGLPHESYDEKPLLYFRAIYSTADRKGLISFGYNYEQAVVG